jgi:hypothetical protein
MANDRNAQVLTHPKHALPRSSAAPAPAETPVSALGLRRLVVIESPYGTNPDGSRVDAETLARNERYLDACMLDSFARGEFPFASHGLYPRVLRDARSEERARGLEAGFAWGTCAPVRAFYVDLGFTDGMRAGREQALFLGQRIEYRNLPGWEGST